MTSKSRILLEWNPVDGDPGYSMLFMVKVQGHGIPLRNGQHLIVVENARNDGLDKKSFFELALKERHRSAQGVEAQLQALGYQTKLY